MLGDGIKKPRFHELDNRSVARKSLVSATDIQIGDMFGIGNLTIKRPGTGRSPMEYWDVIGSRSRKLYSKDEVL